MDTMLIPSRRIVDGIQAAETSLNERDRAVLEFERLRWRYLAAKESAIQDQFGISMTRYTQILHRLLEDPAALAHDPQTVRRLRSLREQRRGARSSARMPRTA